ncbi:UDP-N-acetylmuramoyl-L-alanine--D-glutamate ligase [Halanaerobium congolense]|uniref:UDP-N-acetylmuramoylalanine--D-glutamate ligase n=1 Tax=Halanaerobium congolense TaxID=54121 RepID=A0A1M7HNR1_9FIRM|nr:UDP-N-acetylmuramoyl-L-alanine--D-glutamate ligase [Halanaerobium congolense]PXV69990.1 UDP-N-acetylmuramoylalanine--D-glutamate ligase [Halanaerobium congolense]TDS33104.1 UDP-N-acetylmuramoylalanine--D-glutamate ligase [Halanaerobium congolense]TDX48187.1 UDP-N-acetylmuramoylalanine--D-glutamate ligase [Halanaerobium congolense]SHM30059.1 UDP-N-acetylmuramoylalanine--D-glutamate ligase [Halanaerobium congolense]
MTLDYKKIAVLGFSPRTGLEVVKYLLNFDVNIIVSDAKPKTELKDLISQLDDEKIEYDLGSKGSKILESELIILSPGVPYDLEILKKAREQGIETISEIEFAFRQSKAEIIAVTGTNGKTTTTELLAAMLFDLNGQKIKAAGNIGLPFISIIKDLEEGEKVILELSSFQLEAVKDFKAKIAIYLNYSPDHLDRHQTELNYKNAKKNIFSNQNSADYALLNFDDPYLYQLKDQLQSEVIGLSFKRKEADLIIKNNQAYYKKDKINLLDFSTINLPGKHNQKNAAFAALAAYTVGQSIEKIQQAAENYKLQSHRMEIINNSSGYLIVDDSKATNPDSTLKALSSLDKDIILIAGGQDRNADFSKLKQVVNDRVKILILLGEAADKLASLFKENEIEIIKVKTMEAAAELGAKRLRQDRALLLSPACPSWDMFSSYKERGEIFRKTVLKYID